MLLLAVSLSIQTRVSHTWAKHEETSTPYPYPQITFILYHLEQKLCFKDSLRRIKTQYSSHRSNLTQLLMKELRLQESNCRGLVPAFSISLISSHSGSLNWCHLLVCDFKNHEEQCWKIFSAWGLKCHFGGCWWW